MNNEEYREDLRVRVAVLEERSDAHAKELAHRRGVLEQSNAAQTQNYAEVKQRVETLEQIVDELRINTALMQGMSKTLDALKAQADQMNASLEAIQLDVAKQRGFVAGVVVVVGALGGAVWGVVVAFKDEILRWFR